MPNVNDCHFIGHVTQENELKYTPSGVAILNNSIAVNKKWKDKEGNDKEKVAFIPFKMFGKTAETFVKYVNKGNAVYLSGEIDQESWETPEGQKRSKLVLNVQSMQFLGSKDKSSNIGESDDAGGVADQDIPF
jgi:single-strand DNA-binding protein